MRFVLNPHLTEELKAEDDYHQAVDASATAVADQASVYADQAHEPWMRRQAETIVVEHDGDDAAVINTDSAGHLAEWGSKNNPPHAPLRRAVRAAGLRFTEE